jgi:hypothetical protein
MNDGEFEWDDAKAAQNFTDHGVSFEAAKQVFQDPFAIERVDDREIYGEDRYVCHRHGRKSRSLRDLHAA